MAIAIRHFATTFLLTLVLTSCNKESPTLFELITSEHSGIEFTNTVTESDSFNILDVEYVYNGGGVGIGDFNNDGQQDVYFTGNMVNNKLYLNLGDFQFRDITKEANVEGTGKWCSGITLVDINNDGWLDIYVNATLNNDPVKRKNMLFVNKGIDKDGIPKFSEEAEIYGIADNGHSTHSSFFDYDNDGDQDLYIMNNFIDPRKPPNTYRHKITDGSAPSNDRLYRNNGNGTFTNVTEQAGILIEGYGLGLAITDINMDGWQDVYVSNDYLSNDLLWINNKDGSFTNKAEDYLKHQSASAMGNDIVDINNDGLVDIIVLDMMPEDNQRKKMMIRANNYITYINNERYGYEYQYVRNTLQLNSGPTPKGHPVFMEIGMLAGIHQTDWSWAPLVADFDNDGFRDIIITNGFPRDVTDHDFAAYSSGIGGAVSTSMQLVDSIPTVKIANYAFRNNGDLTFADKTQDWGLNLPSYSNGAAYADLDNDGDLDFIVNNINDAAFVYKNSLNELSNPEGNNNFLQVKFKGSKSNREGLGARLLITCKNGIQSYEHSPYRGYLSTMENQAHFGLGAVEVVDSLQVFWQDGSYELILNIPAGQRITLDQSNAKIESELYVSERWKSSNEPIFQEVAESYKLKLTHQDHDKIDFNLQRTMPHKFTQNGPGIAVGDVDGNGYDDFFIGGSAGKTGTFFFQHDGQFTADSSIIDDVSPEDLGVLFFDADNDNDLDLYIVSGSYEFKAGSKEHQDRLYINNGKGRFEIDTSALPVFTSNGSCVKAADFDKDGDLDLFVGGSVIPGQYPHPSKSYIFRNDQGTFTDVTTDVIPELPKTGIISDVLWTDFDNDGSVDIILAGEWMPLTFFKNNNGTFENITSRTGISSYVGWWNSLCSGDFDNDGDIDYIAGNLGQNTNYKASEKYPLSIYAKDFDNNGSIDPVVAVYLKDQNKNMAPFPINAKDDMTSQILPLKKRFINYKAYSTATINDVLSPQDQEKAMIIHATHMSSSYIENLGNGQFNLTSLPTEAQFAPVYGMVSEDFDEDGNIDIVLAGNNFGMEVTTGRYDASNGLYLKGNGDGSFKAIGPSASGFFVDGDAKGVAILQGSKGEQLLLTTENKGKIKLFNKPSPQNEHNGSIRLEPMDAWAEILYENGKKQRKEFYYGNTYLSQSSRFVMYSNQVKSVTIYDYFGNKRQVIPGINLVNN